MIKIQKIEEDKYEIWLMNPVALLGYWNCKQVEDARGYLSDVIFSEVKSSHWYLPPVQRIGEKFYPSPKSGRGSGYRKGPIKERG